MAKNSYGWASPSSGMKAATEPAMPERTLPERNWRDYGNRDDNLGQVFSDNNQYSFSPVTTGQVPRTQAPERAPSLANTGTTYAPRPLGSSQQAPVSQQNNYTDGRWNPPTGGNSQPLRPARQPAGAGFLNDRPAQTPPASGAAPIGGYGGRGGGVGGFGTQGASTGGGQMTRQGVSREGTAGTTGQPAPSMPTNFDLNQLLSLFQPGGRFAPDQLGQGDRAPEMQYYANSITPFLNYINQAADRGMTAEQFAQNLAFQQQNSQFQQGIDDRGMTLQESAFAEGNRQWGSTFNEDQRRYNLDYGEGQRQFDTTTGFNYDRMNTEDQQARALAQLQSQTARRGQDVDAYGIQQRTGVDMRGQDVERYLGDRRIDSDVYLGDRQYDTQRYGIDTDAQIARLRNTTDMRGQDVQERLGNLQYGTQRYGIDTEAEVARQRMQNELMQSRYATFGRAQQPNFRMMGGWR